MNFFLIVGGGLSVAILVIYGICRLLHIEVKLSALVLCAVLALAVNALAVKMSPFLDKGHYIRLGLLVVVAAAIVTLFNEKLLRREEALAAEGKEAVLTAIKKPLPWEDETAPPEDAAPADDNASAPASADAIDGAADADEAVEREPEETASLEAPAMPEARPTEQEAREYASEQVTVRVRGKETAETVKTEKIEAAQEKTQALAAEIEARETALREEKLAELAAEKQAAEAKLREEREEKLAIENVAREQARTKVAALATLDDILDYIYEVKGTEPIAAAVAYGEAIRRFADDSYTPFLIIELSTLYREQGDYAGAIRTYEHALTLPIIAANGAMQQEMTKNLGYLRTVSDILTAHQAQATPFATIPAELKQEIEAEFEARSAKSMGE